MNEELEEIRNKLLLARFEVEKLKTKEGNPLFDEEVKNARNKVAIIRREYQKKKRELLLKEGKSR